VFVLAWLLVLAAPSWAAGAIAVGKCGAYGQAYDYAGELDARAAALKQCKGECTAVTMKRACAALSVDMANPAVRMVTRSSREFRVHSTRRRENAMNSAARNA
jgi:uncharacterized protein DUF4189